jgi:hypothetical protein
MPKVKKGNQMEHDPKAAAAIAAVMQYIKTHEEAIALQSAMQAPQPQMPRFDQLSASLVKPWGVSGRQAQMQLRILMQLKSFHKR